MFSLSPGGIDPILRGMIVQNLKLPDGRVTDAVTERLFHIVAQVCLSVCLPVRLSVQT